MLIGNRNKFLSDITSQEVPFITVVLGVRKGEYLQAPPKKLPEGGESEIWKWAVDMGDAQMPSRRRRLVG